MSSRDVLRRIRTPGVSALGRQLGETPLGVWIIKQLVSPLDRRIYQLSGGRRVSTSRPLGPILLLTTTGRHTGKEHTTPLFYLRDNERLIICNVNPGFERPNPSHEHNAQQSDEASGSISDATFRAVAPIAQPYRWQR